MCIYAHTTELCKIILMENFMEDFSLAKKSNLVEQEQSFLSNGQKSVKKVNNKDPSQEEKARKVNGNFNQTAETNIEALDGGYGWVIVFACFVLQCFATGLLGVFSVFLPQFLDYYGSSRGKTAITGSMISAGTMIPGPFVSVLVSIFGCRKVAMIGGLFITSGLALSTLSQSVNMLIVTFGAVAGLGTGLVYLPLIVMVGFYFEKKRAIAMGITTSGAGVGIMVLGSLSGLFLENFDWKNALLFICCLALQCVVCGALLRPIEQYKCGKPKKQHYTDINKVINQNIIHKSLDSSLNQFHQGDHSSKHNYIKKFDDCKPGSQPYLVDRHNDQVVYYSELNISKTKSCTAQAKFNPLLKKDIFYSGSIKNIPEEDKYHCQDRTGKTSTEYLSQPCCRGVSTESAFLMRKMLGLGLLTDVSFLIILIVNALFHTGYVICICFITDYGISTGVEPEDAAKLVSSVGIGITLGRILGGGVVTYVPKIGPVQATSISLILAGLCSLSIPLLGKTFLSLLILSGLTGFFLGPITPITAVMQVDFLGLNKLTNSQGMLSLGKGVISLVAVPIAGLLQDAMGSLSPPFYFSAAIFILSGGLVCTLLLCSRKNDIL